MNSSKNTDISPPISPADETPPDSVTDLARDYPGLVIAGGVALGLLAGALLPRGTARRLIQGAVSAAALGGEASLSVARKARDSAQVVVSEGPDKVRGIAGAAVETASDTGRQALDAARRAGGTGTDLARAALKILAGLRR